MKETRIRQMIAGKIDAEVVTSCDEGGHRRFKSRLNGKWGYCTDDGKVVQIARFEVAEHFNKITNSYDVVENGKERHFDTGWNYCCTPWQNIAFDNF